MNLFHLVLALSVLFAGVVWLLERETEYLPSSISVSGPIVMFHSKVGFSLVERIASYRTTWKQLGSFGVVVCFIGMVLAGLGIGTSAVSVLLRPEQTQVTQPQNYLAIPGVNDFLPMSVAVEIGIALVIGVVLHEGAHAVLCRVEDIDLDSTGLVFLSFIPMGAFVEPDEESQEKASRIGRMRMASAGILSNLGVTLVSVLAIIFLASFIITTVPGGAIGATYENSPAAQSSLTENSVITDINGDSITSNEELLSYLDNSTAETLTVTTEDGGTHTINRSVFVAGVQNDRLSAGDKITAVNGQNVSTVAELQEAARSGGIMTVTVESGETKSLPAGAQVQLQTDSGPQVVTITQVGPERVLTGEEAQTALNNGTSQITYYTSGSSNGELVKQTTEVTTEDVQTVYSGVSGVMFNDTGVITYPAGTFLSVLQFDGITSMSSLVQVIVLWFVLPLGSLIPGLTFNFPGFTENNAAFYQTVVGSGMAESSILFIVTAFFWMAWMNFNLALFNCLPIWALDGHHVLRDGLQELDARIDSPSSTPVLKTLEYGIPLAAVLMFVIVLLAPVLVSML